MSNIKRSPTSTTIVHKRGRRPKQYSQADRLNRMMRALAARSLTVNELAEEFGITRRQVYRDLTHLEAEGHPLIQRADLGNAHGNFLLATRDCRRSPSRHLNFCRCMLPGLTWHI